MNTIPVEVVILSAFTIDDLQDKINSKLKHNTKNSWWMPGVSSPFLADGKINQTLVKFENHGTN